MPNDKKIISWTGYDDLILNVATRPNSKFVVQHHANGLNWEITEESFMKTCHDNQWKHGFFDKIIYSEHTNSFIYRG